MDRARYHGCRPWCLGMMGCLLLGTMGLRGPAGMPAREPGFSDVQRLDPQLAPERLGEGELGIDWSKVDCLPAPLEGKRETGILKEMQKSLDEDRRRRIREQANITYRYWKPNLENRPASVRLLDLMNRELRRAIVSQKLRFDRVRPSFVDGEVELVIPNPDHPAYPSGHAAQARFFAEVFAAWEPGRAGEHRSLAVDVARNREYAGVHYPGDTRAGERFARHVLVRCLRNDKFLRLWVEACREWEREDHTVRDMTLSLIASAGMPGRTHAGERNGGERR